MKTALNVVKWIVAFVADAFLQIIAGILVMVLIGALAAQLWLFAGVVAVVLVVLLWLRDRLGG